MAVLRWQCLSCLLLSQKMIEPAVSPVSIMGVMLPCRPELIAAMRACPRDQFVPEGDNGRAAAFADSPLALQLGFNMSAPHIHATCLEALDLQPGHAVLDIGCGCGISSAIVAAMVRSGSSSTTQYCEGQAQHVCSWATLRSCSMLCMRL